MANSNSEPCFVCGAAAKNGSTYQLIDRRMGVAGEWRLATCGACGVISMDPMPNDVQLGDYYSDYAGDVPSDFSLKAGSRWPWLRKLFHHFSGDVDPRDFIRVSTGLRVLDYGCGNVGYLADFQARGVDIAGAELSVRVVDECQQNGFDIRQVKSFSEIPFGNAEFDIVYLMQVFEHLRDPNLFMEELGRILKPKGLLYLAVPNADSLWRGVFGRNWVSGWFAPFHLFHYSVRSLTQLAGMHGFTIVESWSNTPESWFRLNFEACLFPSDNMLDRRSSRLAATPIRIVLMCVLRFAELFIRNRDCLVIKLQKQ